MSANIYYNVNGDYGLNYGLGHVYRAKEIIQKLRIKKFKILVITQSPSKVVNFIKKILKVKVINRKKIKLLQLNKKDVLINDTFGKDLEINHFFQKNNSKIINLDVSRINFRKGLVINGIIHYKKKIKTNKNIKYFGGFKYLIIRNLFKKLNKKIIKKNIFFVSSGGADYNNFSIKVCSILLKMKVHKIYLMLGKAIQDKDVHKIKSKFIKNTKIKILFNIKNPKKYLDKSKYAIVSGGNILFESLSSNCLVMAIQNYFHQKFAIKYLVKNKCIINLGALKRVNKKKIYKFTQNYEKNINNILVTRRKVIDYSGLDRVIDIIDHYIKT